MKLSRPYEQRGLSGLFIPQGFNSLRFFCSFSFPGKSGIMHLILLFPDRGSREDRYDDLV